MSNYSDSQAKQINDLAEKLIQLSKQIKNEPGTLYNALYHLENIEMTFLESVDFLLSTTVPSTPKEEHIKSMIEEARLLAAEPHNWPEIEPETFIVTIDIGSEPEEEDRPYLVFRVGDLEIYRRPTWYQSVDHVKMACDDMREVYKGRVKDLVLTSSAEYGIVMDDGNGYAKLRKAFRHLRKDYARTRSVSKKAQAD